MRTTVDLPPAVHSRARELARERNQSMSSVVADLVVYGLAALGQPMKVSVDIATGLPMISIGRPVSAEEVDEIVDDE